MFLGTGKVLRYCSGRSIKGVPWADVVCHMHKHGGQIQTLIKNLCILDTNAQYTSYYRSCTTIEFTTDVILAIIFVLSYSVLVRLSV